VGGKLVGTHGTLVNGAGAVSDHETSKFFMVKNPS
jgi:hypothetical protein